jgi:hypothetical protein
VEFQALTGMSMDLLAPQVVTPYQQLVQRSDQFPSIVRWFAQHGHQTVAVHPFSDEMYARRTVYPRLGFREFITDDTIPHRSTSGGGNFISDRAAYATVLDHIDDRAKPLFTHLVTMQNHLPYTDEYADPVPVAAQADDVPALGQYTRGISLTDDATRAFLARLERSPENTVVVFFGDHLPGIYPGERIRDASADTMYRTPYFVWNNFDAPPTSGPPVLTPNELLPLVFTAADADVPGYVELLRRLPPAGTAPGAMTSAQRQAAEDYRLVQYDWLSGDGYSVAGLLGP